MPDQTAEGGAVSPPMRPVSPPSYVPQWTAFWLLVLAVVGYHFLSERWHARRPAGSATASTAGSPWYMILRMPEIPSAVTDVDASQRAFMARLHGLQREGFHLILLSDVHRHLTKGTPLPSRPVILLFDPGHRHTYDMLAPILIKHRIPAVWMTDGDALENSDRRYVSRHATRLMVRSGQWDVGRYRSDGPIQMDNADEGTWTLAERNDQIWSSAAGVFALNDGEVLHGMNRLNVNSTWTPEEFIDRVSAEVPIDAPVRLTARPIRNHLWGLTVPPSAPTAPPFTLESTLEKRANTVSWLGTRGLDDVDVDLSIENLSGEAWLLLRSDENVGESVRVGFSEGQAFFEQEKDHHSKRVAVDSVRGVGRSVQARIHLSGSTLSLALNGQTVMRYQSLAPTTSKSGVIRFTVYDKLRGTAQAEGVRMSLTPLRSVDEGASTTAS